MQHYNIISCTNGVVNRVRELDVLVSAFTLLVVTSAMLQNSGSKVAVVR